MLNVGRTIETKLAHHTLVERGFMEVRYKHAARIDPEGLKENSSARAELCSEGPCAVLVVIPAEVQVNLPATNEDHFLDHRERGDILAMALVVDSALWHSTSKLYFMYFPQAFRTRVFYEENEASAWLRLQVALKQLE